MRAYSIFDDFGDEPSTILKNAGVELTVHPLGVPRPDSVQMKIIFENYDCVIIGTSQKITEDMFENVTENRVIATASVGLDHICVPADKAGMVTIINTPKANAQSVAEYTMGCALACCKRLSEGNHLYIEGKSNKSLKKKPEDLCGKTIGVIGAGNISLRIMEFAKLLGMKVLCWTKHPERHNAVAEIGGEFTALSDLMGSSDVISVNLPNNTGTQGIISRELIQLMREDAIYISVSRKETQDIDALIDKAGMNPNFYVCLDLDLSDEIRNLSIERENIQITPHIAGGTLETRRRMFREVAQQVAELA